MSRERANGPYKHGKRWRVAIYSGTGPPGYRYFSSEDYADPEAAAREYVDSFKEETDNRSVGQAVTSYLEHLTRHGGTRTKDKPLRASSVTRARYHLLAMFQLAATDRPLTAITPSVAERLYREMVGRGVRVDTHRGALVVANAFTVHCVGQGWLRTNPFGGVRPVGERTVGKTVLRVDDARRFVETAIGEGTPEGLACATLLILGLRVSELTDRTVQDLNLRPVLLTVPKGKTRAAVRTLAIPAPLDHLMTAHVEGKARHERLFAFTRYGLHYHVRRICKLAQVPIVCPHGLRGSAATNIVEAVSFHASNAREEVRGEVSGAVERASAQLGHETSAITRSTYIAPGVVESATAGVKARLLGIDLGSRSDKPIPTDPPEELEIWQLLEL